ncbi:MAG: DUF2188 domain-containing protein [Gemmatimonadota bacterium]|nr:DUF2188 domain-containing protein [Gemmatimonadota bacterium]
MTRRKITVARGDDSWSVQMQGSKLSTHRTQADAIDAARSMAQFFPSEVTVQGRDGKFRTGFTYGGTDPFPPRG